MSNRIEELSRVLLEKDLMTVKSRISCAALSLFAVVAFASSSAGAEEGDCSAQHEDVRIEQAVATAGIWANAMNSEGSVRRESRRMFESADRAATSDPPQNSCPKPCDVAAQPVIVFRSIPQKYLSEYDGQAQCERLLALTSGEPFVYHKSGFSSVAEVSEWFSDFSQGEGEDGEDLYERCSGLCSPQYTTYIEQLGPRQFKARAEVVCGHARDKSNNRYRLELLHRWTCVESQTAERTDDRL